jgi:uncharacterized protein YoxC
MNEPTFREFMRHFTGFTAVIKQLTRMEKVMASAKDQINDLSAKVDDLAADVRAKSGTLDPEAQAAMAALAQKVADLDTEVGDADASETVTTPPPVVDQQ